MISQRLGLDYLAKEEAGQGENVLRVGDEAESAGNVFDLLKTPHLRKSTLIM